MRYRIAIPVILLGLGVYFACRPTDAAVPALPKPPPISFNRDIRPILSENCYFCHGPDHNHRKAGLRLDQKESAYKPLKSGDTAIVPGDVDHSAMIQRITTSDPDDHMPPAESGKKLSQKQIDLLKRWVREGAEFEGLWSFMPIKRPELPEVKNESWVRNPIDRFVLAKLESQNLTPSPEADRATLIRRLSFDLIGLPPTPAEVDAFVNDKSPDAYEKLVDRLLANPHYGERMALEWCDDARFADTHGYHIDSGRNMTAWRDWVIKSFNSNKRFDQFTIEQIAGDLLPNATLDDKIASGFQRNSMVNFEGGAIPEEYLAAYQIDRVNTMGAVWLGLTIGCCQCHDHKFDPLTQKDFYQLYAFFNSIAENGLDGSNGNAVPVLPVPTAQQQKKINELQNGLADVQKKLDGPNSDWDARQAAWEQSATTAAQQKVDWSVSHVKVKSTRGLQFKKLPDGSILVTEKRNPLSETYTVNIPATGGAVTGIRVEALPDKSMVANGPGRGDNGNFVLTGVSVTADKPLAIRGLSADFSQENFPVSAALENKKDVGWAIYPEFGKRHYMVIEFTEPVKDVPLTLKLAFESKFDKHAMGRFRISTTSSPDPRQAAKPPADIATILTSPIEKRSDLQKAKLREFYRTNVLADARPLIDHRAEMRVQLASTEASVPTTMVMQALPKPRDTFILIRGMYDKHGEKVTAGTPAALPPLGANMPHNRLGLAEWLVAPNQPLTARVVVNRYWQMFFGIGIVKSSEDFGMQGEFPSHPELLDWLASEFVKSGWNIKAMQRLIVTSAAYRQSSHASPEMIARDPENRLLAHGPRFRLDAEFIRDEALAVSGLLNGEVGGQSVLPYQPPGLWEELMSRTDGDRFTAQKYVQSHGKDLYRRGLYTFRKRTSPPPELEVLDAPTRERCTVRRSRTNTPLQALELMNDPTFVEASRKLAERAMTEGGSSDSDKIGFVFKLCTSRTPNTAEMKVLQNVLAQERTVFKADPSGAAKLLTVGESPRNPSLDRVDHAAWTMLCNTVLNLDETVTKN